MSSKTKSELLFEQYLHDHVYTDWEHEPTGLAGQSKRPDYLLRHDGKELLLEVKEMHEKRPRPGGAVHINPYTSLRSEIDEARLKFKKLKGFCCSLVAYNFDDWEAGLDADDVYGAMLGDLGFTFTINFDAPRPPRSDEITNVFMDGGKMVRPNKREPQNTTISSVVVLEKLRAFKPEVHRKAEQAVKEKRARLARDLTLKEIVITKHDTFLSVPNSRFNVVRVQVFENPFARYPLPRTVFSGPFDMRWAYNLVGEEIQRVFVGPEMAAMEEVDAENDD